MNIRATYADPTYPYGDHVYTTNVRQSTAHPPTGEGKGVGETTSAKENIRNGMLPNKRPNGWQLIGRILPTLYTPTRLMRTPTVLMAVAFAATAALLLVVAGGTWAIFQWPNLPPEQDPNQVVMGYKGLAAFAAALLLVPAFTLGQSAATLATRRQDEQLSTLSLLGAPRGLVVAAALAEPLAAATVGSLAGVVGYFVLLLPVSQVHLRGEPVGYVNMILPWWLIAGTVVALILVSMIAAVIGLRRIVISPLGVRTKSLQSGFPWGRIIAGVVLLSAVGVTMFLQRAGGTATVIIVSLFAMVLIALVAIDVMGVLLVRLIAHLRRRSSKLHVLVAARLVGASPKKYWRRVSGLGLTAFIAAFCGSGAAAMQGARNLEATRNAPPLAPEQLTLIVDMFTGVLLILGIAFTFITVSAIINQSADIFDRASTFRELHSAGMSRATVKQINMSAVMMPIVWVVVLSAGFGLFLALPMVGMATIVAPLSLAMILASVVAGALLIRVGIMVTNPLIRRVTAQA